MRVLVYLHRIIGKDQLQLLSIDSLIRPQAWRVDSTEERDETAILVKMLKDLASLKLEEEGISVNKVA